MTMRKILVSIEDNKFNTLHMYHSTISHDKTFSEFIVGMLDVALDTKRDEYANALQRWLDEHAKNQSE